MKLNDTSDSEPDVLGVIIETVESVAAISLPVLATSAFCVEVLSIVVVVVEFTAADSDIFISDFSVVDPTDPKPVSLFFVEEIFCVAVKA